MAASLLDSNLDGILRNENFTNNLRLFGVKYRKLYSVNLP